MSTPLALVAVAGGGDGSIPVALWLAVIGGGLAWAWQLVAMGPSSPRQARTPTPIELTPMVVDDGGTVTCALEISSPGRPARVAVRVVAAGGRLFSDVGAPWAVPWADWEATGDPLIREVPHGRPVRAPLLTASVVADADGATGVELGLYADRGLVRRRRPVGGADGAIPLHGTLELEVRDLVTGSCETCRLGIRLIDDALGARWEAVEGVRTLTG